MGDSYTGVIGSFVGALVEWPLSKIFYNGSCYAVEAAASAARFSGKGATFLVSQVHPSLGKVAEETGKCLGQAATTFNQAATAAITDKTVDDFTASELTGPLALTLGSGWLAARSAHQVIKGVKMLATGERTEVQQETKHKTETVHLRDRVFIPHSTPSLAVSTVSNLFLAPAFGYMGYLTEKGITNRLSEIGAKIIPVPYLNLTLTAASLYAAYQAYSYLSSRENADTVSVSMSFEPIATEPEAELDPIDSSEDRSEEKVSVAPEAKPDHSEHALAEKMEE